MEKDLKYFVLMNDGSRSKLGYFLNNKYYGLPSLLEEAYIDDEGNIFTRLLKPEESTPKLIGKVKNVSLIEVNGVELELEPELGGK